MTRSELERELERLHAECWGWALACCGRDRELAEEALQTAYVRILSGRATFRGRSSVKTWVFGVIRVTSLEEFGRRFIADVFVPAMQQPKGLPRLDTIVQRWIVRMRDVEIQSGCIYTAGAFELDDREGELRDTLFGEITRWRAALRRTVMQAVDAGHLRADTDAEQLVSEIYALSVGLLHDARFLRDSRAAERAQASWKRLLRSYQTEASTPQ